MATETADRRAAHRRSLAVTAVASLGGVAAGLVTPTVTTGAADRVGLALVFLVVVVELGVMHLLGVDVEEFGTKDHLYIAFMTFALWFVTAAILFTTGASI